MRGPKFALVVRPAPPMPIPVALVEDLPVLRRGLLDRLALDPRVAVVGAYGSGEALLAAVAAGAAPRVVLMDLGLPGISGVEATARLRAAHPAVDVLVLTVLEDEEQIFAAVQAGALGYLLKDTPADRIVDAVAELVDGGVPLSPVVARKLLRLAAASEPAAPARPAAETFRLTEREHEILRLAVRGDTEARIAEQLFISPHTVRTHLVHVYEKLQVRTRAAAVRVAMEQRLV